MIKHHPLQYPVVCWLQVPPALMEKAFGRGFTANRNGNYALKEWDFVDSNFDRFLVYDYKGTTSYWGENMEEEEYEVRLGYGSGLGAPNLSDSGSSRTPLLRSFGRRPSSPISSR